MDYYPFVHLWEQHQFALYAEISVDLHCVGFVLYHLYRKKEVYYYYDGWIQFDFWLPVPNFTSSTSFQCIRCMSWFFPVVPRPVPTISRTVVSFATVYTDWQSGSMFISSKHVGGEGGHSTKITELIIQTISAPVATFTTSRTYISSRTCTCRSSSMRF